jgi:hypothetical protein
MPKLWAVLAELIRVDSAVAINQNTFRKAQEEHARDDRATRTCPDKLQGRADGVLGGVDRPGDHAVGNPAVDHHGPEVAHISHGVEGHLWRNPLVFAELEVGLPETPSKLRCDGVNDFHAAKGKPEGSDFLLDLAGVSEQRDIHNIPQAHYFCRPKDPFLSAFW